MKRNLLAVIAALAIVMGLYGLAWALSGANGPHADYRPGYSSTGCSSNAACHDIGPVKFMPQAIDHVLGTTPANVNFSNFCLSCHNKTGEAHEKAVGTPSNNTYANFTGLTPGNIGVSHSWKGRIKNAGTRIPTQTFFNRTGYMPKGIVACQTCHNGPIKDASEWINWVQATNPSSDQLNYTVLGYASTPQYLNQHLKVYRSAVALPSPPANRRDRKQYLVIPSNYTYNNANATITFSVPQGTNYIYIELAEPYLRGSNAGNALCTDCHIDRVDTSVSHPSGSGLTNNHPTGIAYGHSSGLNDTIKPAATGNAYIENGQVLCTSCHDPHNAASNNGQILREADETALCADCHKTKLGGYSTAGSVNIHNGYRHTSPTVCTDCHGHNSNNVLLIKDVINGKRVNFQSFTGARSFGPDTGYGICEVCHTKTSHHLSSNDPSGQGHNTGLNCTQCHPHSNGFQAGGPGGGCDTCHGFPPAPGNAGPHGYGWVDNTGNKHSVHMTYIQKNLNLTGTAACALCHGNRPVTPHPENLTTAYINPNNSYWQGSYGTATFSSGGTPGKSNTSDDSCTNVGCHFTAGTRYWNDAAAQCDSCHEYPGSPTNDWDLVAKVNGHTVRASTLQNATTAASRVSLKHMNIATAYNAATDTYDSVTQDINKCGKCHANVLVNHQNGTMNVTPNGYAACGSGNFTFNNITTRRVITCSNVSCHTDKTTPNWY